MKSIVWIEKKTEGYRASAMGKFCGGYQNAYAGKTAEEAAGFGIRNIMRYCTTNPEGGEFSAPPEVMSRIPDFLKSIPGRIK